MNQWYSKDLGDGIEANAQSNAIQNAFRPLFTGAGQPIGMAVFSRYENEKNVVTAYFSPDAATLAKLFDAHACEKPKMENRLGLLVGDQRCLELFYPTST
jgi:hypothetical protein